MNFLNILVAILALSFLIIVHEFGHFIVAKLSGIKVLEFALFMGPKLFSFQKGETVYSIRSVPLGGFVKMEGEEEDSSDNRAYNRKPVHIRAAVIAAGPLMNLIMAVVILTLLFSQVGFDTSEISVVMENSPAVGAGIQPGDIVVGYAGKKVYHPMDIDVLAYASKADTVEIILQRGNDIIPVNVKPQRERYMLGFRPVADTGTDSNLINEVVAGSPAAKSGMKKNDRIIRLNGVAVKTKQDIGNYVNQSRDNPVVITVLRDDAEQDLIQVNPVSERYPEFLAIGIGGFKTGQGNLGDNIKAACIYGYSTARSVYYSVVWLITGRVSPSQMMGPVGIITTIGEVVRQSPTIWQKLAGLFKLTAFISINLGIMNLVPFPALDGSKLLLLAVEGIRRKAIPPEREAFISMVGLVLLIMLMIFATYNDVLRQFAKGG
jgi:regulator of sigma E protease